MNIWVKATVTDGGKSQRLTLKVEGKGEEAELEIVFGETPIQPTEEAKLPQAEHEEGEKPAVVEETQAEDEEAPLTSEELAAAFDEEPVEQEEEPAEANNTSAEKEHVEDKEEIILEVPATAIHARESEFWELLHRSVNFEDFILKNAEWFELGKRTSYFVEVIKAAAQAEKVNWPTIETILKTNGVQWGSYDKIWTSKRVSNKFKEINLDATFMDLIKGLVENKDFYFSGQATAAEPDTNEAQLVIEEAHDEEELNEGLLTFEEPTAEDYTHVEEQPVEEGEEESLISEEPAATDGTTAEEELSIPKEPVTVPDVSAADGQAVVEIQSTAVDCIAQTAKNGKLEEIAEKSSDFDDFLKNITTWLGLDKHTSYFVEVVKAAAQAKKINWSNIEAILKTNGIHWGASDKILTSKKVTKKFQEIKRDVSIMKLIKEIVGYQDFDFIAHETAEESATHYDEDSSTSVEEETIATEESHKENTPVAEEPISQEEQTLEENQPLTDQESVLEPAEPVDEVYDDDEQAEALKSTRVRMSCMPEIPEFEEALGRIDITQPVTARVKYVLDAMGLQEQQIMDSQLILQIANAAVKSEELLHLDVLATDSEQKEKQNRWLAAILTKANIPQTIATIARMKMTSFINEFTERHCPNAKTVKLLHFLKDLQQVVSDV